MYVSKHHRLEDQATILELIEQHPLGAWVCHSPTGLIANHIPFFLDREQGPYGTLIGHVSRANGVWRQLGVDGLAAVVMFQGPQSYITPGWYPGKTEHGKVVPTWNYTAVHAHGTARAMDDRDWLHNTLTRLTHANEAKFVQSWRLTDAPADYIDKKLRAIVGIEIRIERLEAKLKASQDEDLPDREGTVKGLLQMDSDEARSMAALVDAALKCPFSKRP